MTLGQAREINVKAQSMMASRNRENGDVVVTDEAYETFKEMLHIDCRVVTIEDSFELAVELKKKFYEFARKNV